MLMFNFVTLTIVTGLLGENLELGPTFELFRADKIGRGLLSKLTLGLDPNPLYFGLKLAAPKGGRNGEGPRLFSASFPWWIKAESLEENPGERTSTLRDEGR
jgi:hypothetical protein